MSNSYENSATMDATDKRPFGFRDIIGYFFGDFGCNLSYSVVTYYLTIFYVSYIGIEATHFAALMILTRVFDAVNDPLVGYFSDRIKPFKGNRYKPFILVGGPLLAIISAFMYFDTSSMGYGVQLAVCAISYVAWDFAYTLVNIPYGTLNSVVTDSSEGRTKLSTARSIGAGVAKLPVAIVPLIVYQNKVVDGQVVSQFQGQLMFPVMLGLGVVALISFFLLYSNVEERVQPDMEKIKNQPSIFKTFKTLFSNRALIAQIIGGTAQTIFIYSASQLHQMTLQVKYNDGSLFSWFTLIEIAPLAIGVLMITPLVRKFGKRQVIIVPLIGTLVIYGTMLLFPVENVYLWIGLMAVANMFTFGFQLLSWAMISDAIDYNEWKQGFRSDGSLYSSYIFCRKIGTAFSSAAVPLLIAFSAPSLELNNATTWTASNVSAIYNMSILFPLFGFGLVFIAYLLVFNISKEDYHKMQKDLGHTIDNG